jgi:hypothetical protein
LGTLNKAKTRPGRCGRRVDLVRELMSPIKSTLQRTRVTPFRCPRLAAPLERIAGVDSLKNRRVQPLDRAVLHYDSGGYDLGGATFKSLTTFCLPAISCAKLATLLFSSALRTTPFSVTWPLIDTTFTLCA